MNVVVVGFGGMGKAHYNEFIPNSKFTRHGIYDIDPQVISDAQKSGIKTYESLDALCSDDKVNLVVIATPNDTHKDIAIELMNAGKHVLCEKPVALNSEQLQEMIDVSNEKNVVFSVNQNRRYDRDFLTAKKIIEEKTVGDVFYFESKVFGSRGIPGDWRGIKKHGGGMLFDWGIHLIDQITLFKDYEIKSIYAYFTHISNNEVDDGFSALITFKNNASALISVGTSHFSAPPRWNIYATIGSVTIGDVDNQWSDSVEIKKLTNFEKIEVSPIRAANGFTKTMAPREEDSEVLISSIPLEPGNPVDIYHSIYDAINNNLNESVISHDSLVYTFNIINKIFESAQKNQVVYID